MTLRSPGYHFYQQAFGHAADVRDVVGLSQSQFASCSRDGTIKIWHKVNDAYEPKKTLLGHTNLNKMGINSLYYIKPGIHPIFKEGGLVSSAYDKALCVWDRTAIDGDESTPIWNLWGHEEAPTSISLSIDGAILSGGSDNTGRIWAGNRCVQILRGHKFPVWAIIGLSNGDIVTGSGDRNIKIWRGGECIKTIGEHKDAVRGLTDVPNVGFLSTSNDGTICLWTYDGCHLQTLQGHEGFVYKVVLLPTGELVSASEDGTVKIWRDNQCVQTLAHPTGLWSVAALENGDIVTGGQDGVIRVWSRDESRKASDELLEAYEKEIVQRSVGSIDSMEVDSLPGPEALSNPGTKEGQFIKIKKDGKPHIYTWSMERLTWDYIGEIQGVQKDNQTMNDKKTIDGVPYDFVFDVELGDGGPHRKLPFNLGEDPYLAAQYFIEVQELDQNFLSQIAQFIMTNVPNWKDAKRIPFVRPGKKTINAPQSSTLQVEKKIPPSTSKNFPQRSPVLFDVGNLETILSKIKSFNQGFADKPEYTPLALSSPEITLLESISMKVSQTSRYHVSTFSSKEFDVIIRLLKWPPSQLFPVLDFLRLMVLHPEAAQNWVKTGVLKLIIECGLNPKDAHSANVMLTYRFVANLFMLPTIRSKIIEFQEMLMENITDKYGEANKTTRLTLATALLNFAVLYLTESNEVGVTQALGVLAEVIGTNDQDEESLFRLLVALGTLIYAFKERQSLAQDLGIPDTLDTLMSNPNEKIKTCATELKKLLS